MRILVLASTFPRWPGDTVPPFVYRLSTGLVERGHEVHVLAPHDPGAAKLEEMDGLHVHRFQYAPGRLESLAYGGGILENLRRRPTRWSLVPAFMLAQLVALLRLVRRERIDVVHAHWVIPQGLLAALARPLIKRTVITSAHGGDVFAMTKGIRRRLLRFAASRADACTAVSTVLGDELLRVTGVEPMIIPMGVDPSAFSEAEDKRDDDRAPNRPASKVLFVGRLVQKKGVRYLIEAMSLVCSTTPHAQLLIIGDGPERSELEVLAAQSGLGRNVVFQGAVPNGDLPAYYRAADVLVAPSVASSEGDTEGLPVVLMEAAASGIPMVASRIGGIPDLVQHERTGLLVEPADPEAIASAITRLLSDEGLRQSLAANARRVVLERYSWDDVVDRFDALFRSFPRHG